MNIKTIIVIGLVVTPLAGLIAAVAISVSRPGEDNVPLITVILGFIPVTMTSLGTLLASISATETAKEAAFAAKMAVSSSHVNAEKLVEVHALVNGQSEALRKIVGEEAFARGELAGADSANAEAARVATGVEAGIKKQNG